MLKQRRYLILAVVGLLLVTLALWQVQRGQGPGITMAEPTQAEKTLLSLLEYSEAAKYTITGTLPAGTTIRVWIEAYEFGTRVDDIAACEIYLTAKQRGLSFFHLRRDTEVALAIGQRPMGMARGKYPVEQWADLRDAMRTSGPPEGDLFDGSLVLQVLTHGAHDQWTEEGRRHLEALADPETREQLIAEIDHVYVLKAQASRRPRQ